MPLPATEDAFFELFHTYFPCIYDIRHLVRTIDTLMGGLQKCADTLQVERVGTIHTAGSDALVTAAVFFKLRKDYFDDKYDRAKFSGVLYGLGEGSVDNNWK